MIRREQQLVAFFGTDEAVIDVFEQALAHAEVFQLEQQLLLFRAAALGGVDRQGLGDQVEALEPGHFLDKVDFADDVLAVGRHPDQLAALPFFHGEAQTLHDVGDLIRAEGSAQDVVDPLGAQGDGTGGEAVRVLGSAGVHAALVGYAAAVFHQQLGGAAAGGVAVGHVDALFKALGSFGGDAEPAGGAAVGGGVEAGGFDEDVGSFLRDLGLHTAHDAGDAHGALALSAVGNQGFVAPEHPVLAVQGLHGLAGAGGPHHDGLVLDLVVVEGVQGLVQLQHDEVGDIHHVVDGAHAGGQQVFLHPQGGGPDLDVFDDAGGVAGAQAKVFDADGDVIGRVRAFLGVGDDRLFDRQAGESAGLAGAVQHAQAIAAVGREFDDEHVVLELQSVGNVRAQGSVSAGNGVVQHPDAAVILRDAQLLLGADHALGDTAEHLAFTDDEIAGELGPHLGAADQLAGGHVGRAAKHGERRLFADIHAAQVQVVAALHGLAGEHPAHHHAAEIAAAADGLVQLQSGCRITAAQLVRVYIKVDIVFQPII